MAFFNQTNLAKHIGVTQQYINKLVKAGEMILTTNKKIDEYEPQNQHLIAEILRRKNPVSIPALPAPAPAPTMTYTPSMASAPPDYSTIQEEKCKQLIKQNEILSLKLATTKKELISVDILNRCVHSIFGTLFQKLTNQFPANTTDELIDIARVRGTAARSELIKFQTVKLTNYINDSLKQSEKTLKAEFKKMEAIK